MSLQSNNIKSSPWNWIINISTVSQWNGLPEKENFSEQVTVEIYFVYAYLHFLLIYNDIFSITFKSLPHTLWSNELYVLAPCHPGISSYFLESF
jgi:hypothetical protein